jgi:hypothetical protein
MLNARTDELFELKTTALILGSRSSEMNINSIAGQLGEDERALHYRLIPPMRRVIVEVCLTSSPSQSHV